jgi:transcriptional regulator NrdR family protein
MTKVVKKDGKKEAFSPAKIRKSVESAAKDAGLTSVKAKKLIVEVAEPVIALCKRKNLVKVADLRRSILGRLDKRAKRVSAAWRRYDKRKK